VLELPVRWDIQWEDCNARVHQDGFYIRLVEMQLELPVPEVELHSDQNNLHPPGEDLGQAVLRM